MCGVFTIKNTFSNICNNKNTFGNLLGISILFFAFHEEVVTDSYFFIYFINLLMFLPLASTYFLNLIYMRGFLFCPGWIRGAPVRLSLEIKIVINCL